jgi:hypothetical protein
MYRIHQEFRGSSRWKVKGIELVGETGQKCLEHFCAPEEAPEGSKPGKVLML